MDHTHSHTWQAAQHPPSLSLCSNSLWRGCGLRGERGGVNGCSFLLLRSLPPSKCVRADQTAAAQTLRRLQLPPAAAPSELQADCSAASLAKASVSENRSGGAGSSVIIKSKVANELPPGEKDGAPEAGGVMAVEASLVASHERGRGITLRH